MVLSPVKFDHIIRSPPSRSLSWQQKLTTSHIESSDRRKIVKPISRAAVTVTRCSIMLYPF
ncbi:hypothetical protein [Okeania sp. SIO1I7]|uniref:hypothetical protein n=1 Tax=Okeania sp. SIO1I7 TaxID=2607772 RepID=UPI0013FBC431|nr:hypothetical protein [Okeania sp. SIO1I7]NET26147.1 hypothetical protein [Okeania sp. SIO1I7]